MRRTQTEAHLSFIFRLTLGPGARDRAETSSFGGRKEKRRKALGVGKDEQRELRACEKLEARRRTLEYVGSPRS